MIMRQIIPTRGRTPRVSGFAAGGLLALLMLPPQAAWGGEGGGAASLQFSSATYAVAENANLATIVVTITRSGNSKNPASVDYATSDGTADAGSDYTASSGTLSFGPGEASASFSVPILEDTLAEGDETVILSLFNPRRGATLGSVDTATLTIVDDDAAGADLEVSQVMSSTPSSTTIAVTITNLGPDTATDTELTGSVMFDP